MKGGEYNDTKGITMKVGKIWMIAAVGGGVGLLVVPVYESLTQEPMHSATPAAQTPASATSVSLMVGQQQTFMLQSNAGTGFSWQLAEPVPEDAPASAVLTGVEPDESNCCGFPVPVTLVVTALKPGTLTLRLIYSRPWEKDKAPAKVEIFEIEVRNSGS